MPVQSYAFEPDPDVFLRDFGLPVIAGATEGLGLYSAPGQTVLQGDVIHVNESVTVRADLFGALRYDDLITVGGDRFKVREPIPQSDGVFLTITLEPVALVIEEEIDWGLITALVDGTEDWGLIADAVAESEDWGEVF